MILYKSEKEMIDKKKLYLNTQNDLIIRKIKQAASIRGG